jgi:uncharacterized protein YjbI with pentapeptide repeats
MAVALRIADDLTSEETSSLIEAGELSELMADFILDLAPKSAPVWCSGVVFPNEGGERMKSNALVLYQRQTKRLMKAVAGATGEELAAAQQRLDNWRYVGTEEPGVSLEGHDLRGRDFTKMSLHRANLRGADLREANLNGCDLIDADLEGANLRNAILDNAVCLGANLAKVRADECSALGARFIKAEAESLDSTLTGSSWRGARLLGATLSAEQLEEMDLWGAALPDGTGVGLRVPAAASGVNAVAWSPDGKLLASGHFDCAVRIHEAQTGRELLVCKRHEREVTAVSWSPDGSRLLASASYDTSVRLWEAQTGRELLVCKGHERGVTAVSWSPDSSRLASASYDQSVRLWDAQSGVAVIMLRETLSIVSSVHWSADGKWLVSAGGDGTVWQACQENGALSRFLLLAMAPVRPDQNPLRASR